MLLPLNMGCYNNCKKAVMPFSLTLLVLSTLCLTSQAGVIKKRETSIAQETTATTTTATATSNLETLTTTTITRPKHDPDIGVTTTIPGELRSNDSAPITKLVLQPVGKLMPMPEVTTESLKEYMPNEITLNDSKKLLNNNSGVKETDMEPLAKEKETETGKLEAFSTTTSSLVQDIKAMTNDVSLSHDQVGVTKATAKPENTVSTTPLSLVQDIKDMVNDVDVTKSPEKTEVIGTTTPINPTDYSTSPAVGKPNEDLNSSTPTTATSKENSIDNNHSGEKSPTTTLNIKDNSLETNHISDDSKRRHATNEVTTEMSSKSEESVFSLIHTNGSLNVNNSTALKPSQGESLKSNYTINIQDGLDRDLLKEVSNDLPDKSTTTTTTERSVQQTTEETLDINNKVEYGRSMFKTLDEQLDLSTTPSPLSVNNGKRGKFINDNSTNAQQMNLPSNTEVWSLAGLKTLPSLHNATAMETAPKHKLLATDAETVAQIEKPLNQTQSLTVGGPSEKYLLDWSHIMTDKDLAAATTSSSFQETFNNEVLANNENQQEAYGDAKTPVRAEMEAEAAGGIGTTTTTTPAPIITANSTILSSMDGDQADNTQGDKQNIYTTAAAVNNEDGTSTSTATTTSTLLPNPTETQLITNVTTLPPATATTTATLPLTTVASPTSHPHLNEINLTLNKTITTTTPAPAPTPTTTETLTLFSEKRESTHNDNNINTGDEHNNVAVNVNTTEPATMERVTETAVLISAGSAAAAAAVDSTSTTKYIEQISLSTLETGKANVSSSSSSSVSDFSEKSQKYSEKSDDNETIPLKEDAEKNNENTERITVEPPVITTYKPKYLEIPLLTNTTTNSEITSSTIITTTATPEPPASTSIAEVIDQNGNEIEQKQSINIESTTTATFVSFNNISSTIKTHLNEQVLLETTTPTPTTTPAPATAETTTTTTTAGTLDTNILTLETTTANGIWSEKTTSSSKDNENDEIIHKAKTEQEEEYQLEKTLTTQATPNGNQAEHTTSGQQLASSKGDEEIRNTSDTTTTIVSGSTTPAILSVSNKEQQEIISETTTTTAVTAIANETPVVGQTSNNVSINFASTTPVPILTTTATISSLTSEVDQVAKEEATTKTTQETGPKEEEEPETTTAKVVDTYFKFPLKVNKKEPQPQEDIGSTTTAKEEHKEDDKDLETTTMSITKNYTSELETTTAKEETYISLLDDSTTSSTTSTSTTATINVVDATTPSTTTTPSAGIEITSKIEEIYKVITTTTTEATSTTPTPTPTTTTTTPHLTSEEIDEELTKEILTTTTSKILFNTTTTPAAVTTTTTTMLPPPATTLPSSPSPTIISTANIGGNAVPPLNNIMSGGNSGNMFPKNSDNSGETDVNVIIAITVSVIGVVALILLVAFLYLMRKRQKQTSYSQRCRPVSLDEYAIDNGSIGGSMRKGSALRSSKRTYGNLAFDDPSLRHNAMGVHELAKFAVEKLRIFEEFRDVPQITAREDEVPPGCEDKNRYANVLPLPETRVVLQRLNDDDKTEYINANYVTGPKDSPNYYIACQAPLDTTVEDFWRMIWEQQSRVIIQATDLIENGVEKCAEYLPPSVTLDNHSTFGDFQVTLQNREVKDKYAISTVLLKHMGEENGTRELTHYWYKWPETGVPAEEAPIIAMLLEARSSLISYAIEQANEDKEKSSTATLKSAEEGTAAAVKTNGSSAANNKEEANASVNGVGGNGEINGNISMVPLKKTARNQGPLTIHCSPGTGRTGTIIACDIAIRSLETPKRTVDIPQIVYHVRRGRASAVMTKEQYEFIYKVANMYAAKITNPTNYN